MSTNAPTIDRGTVYVDGQWGIAFQKFLQINRIKCKASFFERPIFHSSKALFARSRPLLLPALIAPLNVPKGQTADRGQVNGGGRAP